MAEILERWVVRSSTETGGVRLTRYEETRWEEITRHLGSILTFSETPIWDDMTAKYPNLDLYSRPIHALARRQDYVRNPADIAFGDDRDYGAMADTGIIERVLAGLRRL